MQDLFGAKVSCKLQPMPRMCHSIIGKYPGILEGRRAGPSRHTASTFLFGQFNVLSRARPYCGLETFIMYT